MPLSARLLPMSGHLAPGTRWGRTRTPDQPLGDQLWLRPAGGRMSSACPSDELWSFDRADSVPEADLEEHLGIREALKGSEVLGLLTKHPRKSGRAEEADRPNLF